MDCGPDTPFPVTVLPELTLSHKKFWFLQIGIFQQKVFCQKVCTSSTDKGNGWFSTSWHLDHFWKGCFRQTNTGLSTGVTVLNTMACIIQEVKSDIMVPSSLELYESMGKRSDWRQSPCPCSSKWAACRRLLLGLKRWNPFLLPKPVQQVELYDNSYWTELAAVAPRTKALCRSQVGWPMEL